MCHLSWPDLLLAISCIKESEQQATRYPFSLAFLDFSQCVLAWSVNRYICLHVLIMTTLRRSFEHPAVSANVVTSIVLFVQQEIFGGYSLWAYEKLLDRWLIAYKVLTYAHLCVTKTRPHFFPSALLVYCLFQLACSASTSCTSRSTGTHFPLEVLSLSS